MSAIKEGKAGTKLKQLQEIYRKFGKYSVTQEMYVAQL